MIDFVFVQDHQMIQFIWWFFGFKLFFHRKDAQSHSRSFAKVFCGLVI